MEEKILPADQIKVIDKVSDWKQAIDIACEPLLDKSFITKQYVRNMKQSVVDNGPYMVLTDYFALMHAKAGEGVNQQCMSLLVTKEEVSLEGKPVKIFLILAAKDNESHLQSLQNIMTIFMDSVNYDSIIKGNEKEIINLFN